MAQLKSNADPNAGVVITPEIVDQHGLTNAEYETIREYLGRTPNLTELGIFSVMWSEHCSYKNSRRLLQRFATEKQDSEAPHQVLVKAGEENAGVVDLGDGWAVCFKIESHNHPSAVEPFEGAATGVGGIIRDIFTMGARPIALTNSLRFGELDSQESRRLFRGVVHGIAHYGNCVGIPNIAGDVVFDECYEKNPLVNACCIGLVRTDKIQRGTTGEVGNPVYYVGPATGRDGLRGAAFASKALSKESKEDRPAVQKGDPFMEKVCMEACLELMAALGLVVGVQDMGAAGLTCSTWETAARGGTGIEIDLAKVPQREKGMTPYEILLSESQERMLVIINRGKEADAEKILSKWDIPFQKIGEVTDTGDMVVKYNGQRVARIPGVFLREVHPIYDNQGSRPAHLDDIQFWEAKDELEDVSVASAKEALEKLIGHPTMGSKRWIYRQYDHMVGANTVLVPGSNAGVIRVRMGKNLDDKFLAVSNDCNARYCAINPYRGGMIAVVESLRNLAVTGAQPIGMTNNLNFGSPDNPESFYFMKECVRGMAEACRFFDVPVTGGNVSLYNEHGKEAIDPTPVISMVGVIENLSEIVTPRLKSGAETIVLLGDLPNELGGSQFLKVIHGLKKGNVPEIYLEGESSLLDFFQVQVSKKKVRAAHDISEGGLLCTLCEMLFANNATYGAELDLTEIPHDRADMALFGESQSRLLVAVDSRHADALVYDAERYDIHADILGSANDSGILSVKTPGLPEPVTWDVHDLRQRWEEAIPNYMKT